jgi:hypothetical protein
MIAEILTDEGVDIIYFSLRGPGRMLAESTSSLGTVRAPEVGGALNSTSGAVLLIAIYSSVCCSSG